MSARLACWLCLLNLCSFMEKRDVRALPCFWHPGHTVLQQERQQAVFCCAASLSANDSLALGFVSSDSPKIDDGVWLWTFIKHLIIIPDNVFQLMFPCDSYPQLGFIFWKTGGKLSPTVLLLGSFLVHLPARVTPSPCMENVHWHKTRMYQRADNSPGIEHSANISPSFAAIKRPWQDAAVTRDLLQACLARSAFWFLHAVLQK